MTRLRQLFEVYPAESRATMPSGLRVDGAVWVTVDGADLLTGEVTAAGVDVEMRTALDRLTHAVASAGLEHADLERVIAHVSPGADIDRVEGAWEAAGILAPRSDFEVREGRLPVGRRVVLEALAALPDAATNFEATSLLVDGPASGVRLGPVLYVPALTAVDHDGALPEGMAAQVSGAFENLDRLLDAAGSGRGEILRIAGYMRDLKDKDYLNYEMVARFPAWSEKPVHKYVPTGLPPGVEFALQVIAVGGAERSILEIEGIKHNDPISLGALAGNVFVSSRVQARLEAGPREQTARLIDSHARRLVEHIGGGLDDVTQVVWGIGDPAFESPVREECAAHWPSDRMPRLDVVRGAFPHSPLPRLEFFALLDR
jgi:enamine deaminase RidA (YjgF/YER057c/UK114 family)